MEFGIWNFCLIETLITSWIEEVTRVTFSTITQLQQNPVFSNYLGKSKFEQSIVKLQGLPGEGKLVLVRIIGIFENARVQEIGILLYISFHS